jgi:transcription elongation factor
MQLVAGKRDQIKRRPLQRRSAVVRSHYGNEVRVGMKSSPKIVGIDKSILTDT